MACSTWGKAQYMPGTVVTSKLAENVKAAAEAVSFSGSSESGMCRFFVGFRFFFFLSEIGKELDESAIRVEGFSVTCLCLCRLVLLVGEPPI